MNTRHSWALLLVGLVTPVYAEVINQSVNNELVRNRALLTVGFESIKLSANENMGLIGASYLIEVLPKVYLGPAAYGAATGRRGGFFTGGGELTWRQPLFSKLELATGMYVGGGGGGSAKVGGGLMLRPHMDLLWHARGYYAGLSASQVNFPNGAINSKQVGLVLGMDSEFSHFPPGRAGEQLIKRERTGVGIDRVRAISGAYLPRKGMINTNGTPTAQTILYVGSRLERFFAPKFYWGVEATGAASGNQAGYAEFMGSLGAETALGETLSVGTRVALGMGGGGSVPVGGGQLAKLSAYATSKLGKNIFMSLEGGYATAPGGAFRAPFGSLSLGLKLDNPNTPKNLATIVENEWMMGTEHYFAANRHGGAKQDLDALTFKINRYLSNQFYLSGQAHSATLGNAGGYSAGFLGAGFRYKDLPYGLTAGAEFLAGAAGGGGVDTSGGMVVQPMFYIGKNVSDRVGIYLNAGHIKSIKGKLNSNILEVSAKFAFGATSR